MEQSIETTRDRILRTGADIVHLKGFNNTGLQEILDAAQVPKGSFYNYFKNKEDFGLAVVDYYDQHFAYLAKTILEDFSIPPVQRISRVLDGFDDFFKAHDFTYGCPIGNLAQEMGDLSPTFRTRLKKALNSMVQAYARVLAEAQEEDLIPKNISPLETALFLVASWHGAIIQMKLTKSLKPLEIQRKFIFDVVLKK